MLHSLQSLLFSAFAFLTVLSIVVFVHEFGHFQVARWCKVAIDTFAIGFGRQLVGWKDKQGVVWKIGSLPLGGYVKFVDDADPASMGATSEPPRDPVALEEARKKGLFHAQPAWVRALVAFAGPGANFVFSIATFAAIAMIFGHDITDVQKLPARIDGIEANSPGAKAGFKVNDVVTGVNGVRVDTLGELKAIVRDKIGVPLDISVRRDGALVHLTATPAAADDVTETGIERKIGRLGIGPIARPDEIHVEHPNPIKAIGLGAAQTWRFVAATGSYIGNIVSGKASASQIAGPVGIFQMSGQVAHDAVHEGSWAERAAKLCANLISLAALLSVAVGIMNLLPVPVLDGGLILFCAIEAVRGRPLDPKAQEFGFRAGLAAVASLLLFATWNDLQRLNVLEFLRGMLS